MCVKCVHHGHDAEDHDIITDTTDTKSVDPLIQAGIDSQINYARDALNVLFEGYIDEVRPNLHKGDWQAANIVNGFFAYMMENSDEESE